MNKKYFYVKSNFQLIKCVVVDSVRGLNDYTVLLVFQMMMNDESSAA